MRHRQFSFLPYLLSLAGLLMSTQNRSAAEDEAAATAIRNAVTFYASFDEAVRGDFGGGKLEPLTRFNHETEPGRFVFEPGIDVAKFRIATDKGIHGGALE